MANGRDKNGSIVFNSLPVTHKKVFLVDWIGACHVFPYNYQYLCFFLKDFPLKMTGGTVNYGIFHLQCY